MILNPVVEPAWDETKRNPSSIPCKKSHVYPMRDSPVHVPCRLFRSYFDRPMQAIFLYFICDGLGLHGILRSHVESHALYIVSHAVSHVLLL